MNNINTLKERLNGNNINEMSVAELDKAYDDLLKCHKDIDSGAISSEVEVDSVELNTNLNEFDNSTSDISIDTKNSKNYVGLDENGNIIASDIQPKKNEIVEGDITETYMKIKQIQDGTKEFRKVLKDKSTGYESKMLEDKLLAIDAKDLDNMSEAELNVILGKRLMRNINKINASNNSTKSLKIENINFKRDILKYFKTAMEMENKIIDAESLWLNQMTELDQKMDLINHEMLVERTVIVCNNKIAELEADTEMPEDEKKNKISIYKENRNATLETIYFKLIKLRLQDRNHRSCKRDFLKYDKAFNNLYTLMGNSQFKFPDIKATKQLPSLLDMLTQVSPEPLQKYAKFFLYLNIERLMYTDILCPADVTFINTFIRNVRSMYFGGFTTLKIEFFKNMREVLHIIYPEIETGVEDVFPIIDRDDKLTSEEEELISKVEHDGTIIPTME